MQSGISLQRQRGTLRTEDYRAVFQASPDGILVVDDRGKIRDANPAAAQLFRCTLEELVGQSVDALVPDPARAGHAAYRRAYAVERRPRAMGIGMELRARRRDGTEFPVEISLSPWETPDGALTIATVRDVTQRKRERDFGAKALHASETERKRIARELHDDTAQRLAALLLRLRIIERDAGDARLSALLAGFREEISACAEGVRRIARGLRPPELEDAGLVAALRAHVRAMREGVGFSVELDADPVDELLDAPARLILYRVVQEALSNVLRHSGASAARVSLRSEGGKVVAVVVDEGKGFTDGAAGTLGGGLGLIGMQERAAGVGGRVQVESEQGKGTRVTLTLPAKGDRSAGQSAETEEW